MRKEDELSKEHTCMQHAHAKEMVFVLLSRDAAAPVAIRAWVAERLRLGKNTEADAQIVDALECARIMETEGGLWTGPFPGLTQSEAERRYKEMVEVDNG
jgi:hypothetical protein